MIKNNKVTFSSHEVAAALVVKSSTVRKYCLLLEQDGYVIEKDEQGKRIFSEENIMILQQVITLKNRDGITVERACKAVMAHYNDEEIPQEEDVVLISQNTSNNDFEAISEEFRKLKEFNEVLLNQLKKQQQHIDYKMDHQHKEVLSAIGKIKEETPKQLPYIEEKIVLKEKKKRNGWLRLLWPL